MDKEATTDAIALSLQKPFNEDDIQWRVQQAGISANQNPYVMAIPYVSNRAIQKRLDEVFGPFGWENAYKPTPDGKGYLCGITIHSEKRSVTKWDGAEYTNIEPLKGALSDSMKRSAVQLGIGRYLYQLEMQFAVCQIVNSQREADNCHIHYPDKKNKSVRTFISWQNPPLPKWAIPFVDYSHFIKAIEEAKDMAELRNSFTQAYKAAESSHNADLTKDATKAKNKRKAYIQSNLDKINGEKHKVIEDWLDGQIKVFADLPNKSTIDNFAKITNEGLLSRITASNVDITPKEQQVNCDDLAEKLANSYKQRINQLKKAK